MALVEKWNNKNKDVAKRTVHELTVVHIKWY